VRPVQDPVCVLAACGRDIRCAPCLVGAPAAWSIQNATTGSLVASGVVTMPGLNLTYPSISANVDGTFVIAFTGSGGANNITDYYSVCSLLIAQCEAPQISYVSPANDYLNAPGGVNRWGDYSWTTVDPTNSSNFWLFQQFALTNTFWGTVITSITTAATSNTVPEPSSIAVLFAGMFGLVLARRRLRQY
jgi:hypothetical protein